MPEQISQDLADLRAATREAHEVIKDLRHLLKECKQMETEMLAHLASDYTEIVETAVNLGLVSYQQTLANAIEEATQAVYNRFDTLTALLLGETKSQMRQHDHTLPETIEFIVAEREGSTDD